MLPQGGHRAMVDGGDDDGGGSGSGDPLVIGKFTAVVVSSESPSFGYMADPGLDVAFATSGEADPQLYPSGARTFQTLRVVAASGNGVTPFTVTLYKNSAPTAQKITVPAGAAAGAQFVDASHPIIFVDGNTYDLRWDKGTSGDSKTMVSAVLEGPAGGGGGGGGGGSVNEITSADGSVLPINDPSGPTVDLSIPMADWLRNARARSTTLADGSLEGGSEWFTDFITDEDIDSTSTSGGSSVLSSTLGGGVLVTSNDATPEPKVNASNLRGLTPIVASATDPIYFSCGVQFTGPLTGVGGVKVGLAEPPFILGDGGSSIWTMLGYVWTGSLGSQTDFCVETWNGSANPLTPTSVALDPIGMHTVEFASDGITGQWYFDGAAVGPAINMATDVGTGALTPVLGLISIQDGTARSVSLDWAYCRFLPAFSGQHVLTASDWSDSLAFNQVVPGVGAPNGQAILALESSAPALQILVYSNYIGSGGTGQAGIGVFIDGAYSTTMSPVANGFTPMTIPLPNDGHSHTVDLVNGFVNFETVGSFLVSYDSRQATPRTVPAPTWRFAGYGDSIFDGALAVPITEDSWFALVRSVAPGRCALEGWGGRSLWDDAGTGSGQIGLGSVSNLAQRLVALAQLGGATTSRRIWVQIGFNDALFGGTGRWSAANYQTAMGQLMDDIHALDAACTIYLASPIISNEESAVNSFGNTLNDYRTACSTVAGARGFVTFVDGPSLMPSSEVSGDNIHPTTAGHATIFADVATILGI